MPNHNNNIKPKDWSAALRSGKYKQCRAELVTDDGKGHCCLGVLSDIADLETSSTYGGEGPRGLMYPESYIDWMGGYSPVADPERPGCGRTWADLNDLDGYTFDQIADEIDREWPADHPANQGDTT